jgi:hypothetical protein
MAAILARREGAPDFAAPQLGEFGCTPPAIIRAAAQKRIWPRGLRFNMSSSVTE